MLLLVWQSVSLCSAVLYAFPPFPAWAGRSPRSHKQRRPPACRRPRWSREPDVGPGALLCTAPSPHVAPRSHLCRWIRLVSFPTTVAIPLSSRVKSLSNVKGPRARAIRSYLRAHPPVPGSFPGNFKVAEAVALRETTCWRAPKPLPRVDCKLSLSSGRRCKLSSAPRTQLFSVSNVTGRFSLQCAKGHAPNHQQLVISPR